MTKDAAVAIAAKYFPNYKKVDQFHITSDGQVFAGLGDAKNHGNSFKKDIDKAVITVTREDVTNAATEAAAKATAKEAGLKLVDSLTDEKKSLEGQLAKASEEDKAAIQLKVTEVDAQLKTAQDSYAAI